MLKKLLFFTAFLCTMYVTTVENTQSYSGVPPAKRTGAPGDAGTCSNTAGCHINPSFAGGTSVNLLITGNPATYIPGQNYSLKVTNSDFTFPGCKYGFEMTVLTASGAMAGVFSAPTLSTTITTDAGKQYISHQNATTSNEWSFNWQAPTTDLGCLTFYMTSVAANCNGSSSGDRTHVSTFNFCSNAVIDANFTATPLTVCTGQTVTFTNTSTGGGITSYNWNFGVGATPATATGIGPHNVTYSSAGTKNATLTIAGPGGVINTETKTAYITVQAAPNLIITPSTATICSGSSGITLVANGATGGTYTWTPALGLNTTSGNTVIASPSSTTTYTCSWTNGICTVTATRLVTIQPIPTISVTPATPSICTVGGSVSLTASGGTGGTYAWSPSATLSVSTGTTVTASPTVNQIYTVNWSNGVCNATTTVAVVVGTPSMSVTPSISPASICAGGAGLTLTATGVSGGTYTWSPALGLNTTTGASVIATPATSTTYSVSWVNGACSANATQVVTVQTPPTFNLPPQTYCVGSNASIVASGPSGSYSWAGPTGIVSTNSTLSLNPVTASAIYTLTWSNGTCNVTQTQSVTAQALPTVVVNPTPAEICFGSGGITLTASGATGGTYSWAPSTGLNTSSGATVIANPLTTRVYTITWSNGVCSTTTIKTVTVQTTPTITISPTPALVCIGGSGVTLTASGGTSGTYTWSPATSLSATTGATVTANPTSNTTYTVTWSNGVCTATATKIVSIQTPPTIAITPTSSTICPGNSVTLGASGGTGGTYTWSPASSLNTTTGTTVIATPTATTIYTVSWSNGICNVVQTRLVTVTSVPTIGVSPSSATRCTSGAAVTLVASGGTGGTYTWTPSAGLNTTTGATVAVSPSTNTVYTVTWSSGSGCNASTTVSVAVNTPPSITITPATANVCAGGSVAMTASGGTGGTYTWAPAASLSSTTGATVTASPTTPTVYTVTWSDGICTATQTRNVGITANPILTITPISPTICTGSSTNLVVSGATGGSYTWAPATGLSTTVGTTVNASPTATTVYTVTYTNASGCSATKTVTVTVATGAAINVTPLASTVCIGNSVALSASGGVGGSYTWLPAAGLSATTGANITASPSSTTIYTVSFNNGICVSTATTTVSINTPPVLSVTPTSSTICAGGTGATLTVVGGTGGTYSWSPASGLNTTSGATIIATPVSNTTYTATWTDGICSATVSSLVTVQTPPILSITPVSPTVCSGASTTLVASGGSGGTYTWSPSASLSASTGTTVIASPTTNTVYTITWSNGVCQSTITRTVIVTVPPTINVTPAAPTVCSGGSTSLTASGGTGGVYTWSPSTGLNTTTGSTVIATLTSAQTYTVTWANGGCTNTQVVTVSIGSSPTVNITPSSPTICSGGNTTLVANGGTGGSYSWVPTTGLSASNTASVVASPSATTTYTVTWNSGTGCIGTGTVTVTIGTPPVIDIASSSSTICNGTSATLTASGATGGTYTWSPAFGLNTTTGNEVISSTTVTRTYTVTWTGGGCSATATEIITVQNTPIISISPTTATICAGNSANLTVSGATGGTYTWSPAASLNTTTGTNVTATPTSTTTYTVSWTNGICTASTTRLVVVQNRPTFSFAPLSICSGSPVNVNASGPSGTYTWSGPSGVVSTTNNLSVTPSGSIIYTLNWTNSVCATSATQVVNVQTAPTISITPSTAVICSGGNITLTASGGTGGVYNWSPSITLNTAIGDVVVASPTTTTTYSVTWTNGICTKTTTRTVVVTTPPTISVTPSSATLCEGSSTSLVASGGSGGTYSWLPTTGLSSTTGSSTTASPTSTTAYTVTWSNGLGCNATKTVTVTVVPINMITVTPATTTICAGATGTTLVASGGTSGTYTWAPSSGLSTTSGSSVTANPTSTTTYTATWSSGGCTTTATAQVVVNNAPTISIAPATASVCTGQSINLTAIGGTGGTYTWAPASGLSSTTGATVTAAPAINTTYTVTWTDGICTKTSTKVVVVTTPPNINITPTAPSICIGSSVTLTASGGLGGTYSWAPVAGLSASSGTSVTANPISTTTYTVTWTGATGCSATEAVVVSVTSTPTINVTPVSSTLCIGSNVVLTASGGAGGTYTWAPASSLSATTGTTVTATPATSTVYTITWSNGTCSSSTTATVTVASSPALTITTPTTVVCTGGTVALNVSGGTGGTYTWSPAATLNTTAGANVIASPTAASTTYTVTWSNGTCTSNNTVTITRQTPPTVNIAPSTALICAGGSGVGLTATGATGGSYTWAPVAGLSTTTGAGVTANPSTNTTYTVTWTNGICTTTATRLVTVQDPPVFNFIDKTICNGGSASTIATGPAGTYSWSGPSGIVSSTSTLAVSPTTTTIYTLNFSNGVCTTSTTQTIVVQNPPSIIINPSSAPICVGGSVTLTASGSSTGTYTWTPATGLNTSTGPTVIATPGTTTVYTVSWTDGICIKTATRTVNVTATPVITLSPATSNICLGSTTILVASGGTGGTYTWLPATGLSATTGSTVIASPTVNTVYTVTWSNGAGCSATQTTSVTIIASPIISVTPPATSICAGGTTTLVASGATGGTYTWSPSTGLSSPTGATVTANPTATTTYTVNWSSSGCTSSTEIVVTVTAPPAIVVSPSTATICPGASTALVASGAVGGTYVWTPSAGLNTTTGASVIASPTGTTNYTVTWSNGTTCSTTKVVTVTVAAPPAINVTPASPFTCAGGTGVSLTASGGTGGTYTWAPASGLSSTTGATINANPAVSTTYTVTWTNAGCSQTKTLIVNVQAKPTITVSPSAPTICEGGPATTLTASGAAGGTYTWAPAIGLSATAGISVAANPPTTQVYTITWTNGVCISTTTTTVTVQTAPVFTFAPITVCKSSNATVNAAGPAGTYSWSGPAGLVSSTSVLSVFPTATSTYTMTWTNGVCSATATQLVNVQNPPVLSTTTTYSSLCAGTPTTITASGGTGGIYTWSPGASLNVTSGATVIASPSVTTIYTVTWSDGICTVTQTRIIAVSAPPIVNILPSMPIICAGGNISLTASGATGGTYTWSPAASLNTNVGSTVIASPTMNTNYTVIWTNSAGCSVTQTILVSIGSSPPLTITPSAPTICVGTSTTLTASGATGGTYTWAPAIALSSTTGAIVTASPTSTTTYTVNWTNGACTSTKTVLVTVGSGPVLTVSPSASTICQGASTLLSVAGATGGTYTWLPASGLSATSGTNVIASPTTTTVYTVNWSNGTGCVGTTTVTVTVLPVPAFTISPSAPTICPSGSQTLTVAGGSPGTYTWLPTAGLNTATGTSVLASPAVTTSYTVTWTGASGCTYSKSVTVNVQLPPISPINLIATDYTLCEGQNLTIDVTDDPTTRNYDLYISTPLVCSPPCLSTLISYLATGNTFSFPASIGITTYAVVYNYGAGCQVQSNDITINVTDVPVVTAMPNSFTVCTGTTTTLTASGATFGAYTWAPSSGLIGTAGATVIANPTATTTYTVTWTGGNGCTRQATTTVTVIPNPIIAITKVGFELCAGTSQSNTLTASGGTGGIYNWSPSAGLNTTTGATVIATPSSTTVYTVTWSNTSGCVSTSTSTVTVVPNPTLIINNPNPTLCAGNTGTLTASGMSGGAYTWLPGGFTGPTLTVAPTATTTYTASWAPVYTTPPGCSCPTIVNPVKGTSGAYYTNSCFATCAGDAAVSNICFPTNTTSTITITANPILVIAPLSPSVCLGGSIELTVSGAAGGTYSWTPSASLNTTTGTTVTATPTSATTYTVTWNNGLGCISTQTILVGVFAPPAITITPSSGTICAAGETILLTASGGAGGTYTWAPSAGLTGSPGNSVIVSPSATTVYTVTWSNGVCSSTSTVLINVSSTLLFDLTPDLICSGEIITKTVTPNVGSFSWVGPTGIISSSSTLIVSPTVTTTYTLNWNEGSCNSSQQYTVNVQTPPLVSIVPNSASICSGESSGLVANGATGGTYTWVPSATLSSSSGTAVIATPISTTTYTVDWTDGVCAASASTTIAVTSSPLLTIATSSSSICLGENAVLEVSGASGGIYTWSPSATLNATSGTTVTASPTITTTYTVNWSNGLGCISIKTITIAVGTANVLSATPSSATICVSESTTLTVSGGIGGTYTWLPSSSLSAPNGASVVATPTATTTYTVVWTNSTGCSAQIEIPVTVATSPSISVSPISPTICNGASVALSVSGATGGSYTWLPNVGLNTTSGSSVIANPSVTTTYTVNWSNTAGCAATTTVTVNIGLAEPLLITPTNPQICVGGSTTLIASGPTGGSYSWAPVAGLSSATSNFVIASPLVTTIYTVTWTNGIGCSVTNVVAVEVVTTPTLVITPSAPIICDGGAIVLNTTGPATGSYTWLPTAGLINNNSASIVAAPMVTTTYTVNYTNGLGCNASQAVTVTVGSPTIGIVSTATTICTGGNTTLSASGPTDGLYSWSPAIGLSASTGTTVIANPSITTNYTVTYTNTVGCYATASVLITVTPTLINATTNKYSICLGSSAALAVGGATGGTYTWSPATGLSTTTGANVTASPLVNTTYTVTWSNGICTSTDTINIIANDCGGALSLSVTDPCFCLNNADDNLGNNGQFGAVVYINGGVGPYTLNFSSNAFAYNSNNTINVSADIASLAANPSGTTAVTIKFNSGSTYNVIITDATGATLTSELFGGCTYPTLNLGNDKNACEGTSVALIPVVTGVPLSYNWSTGAVSSNINVTANPVGSSSSYGVTISDANGCAMNDNILITGINCNIACQDTFYSCSNPFPATGAVLCVPACQLPLGYTIVNATSVFNCTLGFPTPECVSYTPLPGMPLGYVDEVAIIICNGAGICHEVIYFVTIGCTVDTEHAPMWVNPITNASIDQQTIASTYNNCITIPIKAMDIDSGDVITYSITQPADGSAWYNANHTAIIYCPAMNACGMDTILLTATDLLAPIESDVLTLIINTPCPPEACNDTLTYCMGVFPAELLVCPEFCEFIPVTIEALPTFECSIDYLPTGCFIYSPLPGITNYNDTIEVIGINAAGLKDTTYVIVTVSNTPCPLAPNAVADNATMTPGGTVTIPVLANDTYGAATVTIVPGTGPAHGYVIVNPNGSVTYVSTDPTYIGVDCFDYQLCDAVGCDIATACVTTTPLVVNAAPVAVNDLYSGSEGLPIIITPTLNDSDPNGDVLTYTVINAPNHGTLVGSTYNPGTYVGVDSIQYQICDPAGLCDSAWVIITIIENQPPVIIDTLLGNPINNIITTITEDSTYVICNIGATDAELDVVDFNIDAPANGTFIQNPATGCWTYTPNPNWNGTDTVLIIACDPLNNCDTLQIVIIVTPIDDPVVANFDEASVPYNTTTSFNIISNDSAVDGPILPAYISIVDSTTNGVIFIDPITGVVSYTPNNNFSGADSFVYSICITPANCDTAIVYINVGQNPNPVNVVAVQNSDTTNTVTNINITVLANDTITANTVITTFTQPTNGIITLSNGVFTYVPYSAGLDSFQYTICDTVADVCSTTWVYVLVEPAEDVIIYQGITPGKDGINDEFIIIGIDKYPNNQLMIFNRWGDKVYSKDSYTNNDPWRGDWFDTGKTLPDGTYYYMLYLDRNDKSKTPKSGFVVIHRD